MDKLCLKVTTSFRGMADLSGNICATRVVASWQAIRTAMDIKYCVNGVVRIAYLAAVKLREMRNIQVILE